MAEDLAPNHVPVLYFDRDGLGPDELVLEVNRSTDMTPGRPTLGIRIRKAGMVIRNVAAINGGYMLDRASVSKLHDELTLWLVANPKPVQTENSSGGGVR